MPDLWRISNHRNLTGEGGLRYAARWHSAGQRIVYLAESPAGALIEVLVHLELDQDELPPAYTLLHVSSPDELPVASLPVPAGDDWKSEDSITRKIGDAWLTGRESALARVPSAILPSTFNVLLNPLHPDAERIQVTDVTSARFDARLLSRQAKKR